MNTAVAATPRLLPWALYGAMLSGAGLPIYIYAPKFFADTYGTSLSALAVVLFGLRLLDVVQDPALGWVSERLGARRGVAMAAGAGLLALSMLGLFAVVPPLPPLVWFALTVTGLFSAFSFLTIGFYAQGVRRAESLPGGHVQLAAWRESGALAGVCTAAVAPSLLTGMVAAPYAVFAWGFVAVVALSALAMAPMWEQQANSDSPPVPLRRILSDHPARRLLLLALVNAAPLAVTSTLFLFYVESRLGAPGWEGPLLVLFFLSAAASAPGWGWLAGLWGARRALQLAMGLAIVSFAGTLTLGAGDVALFAVICVVSGASIGADLTLLPALFARRMATVAPNGGQGFGLWALVTKLCLALAAVVLLPLLDVVGFRSGAENDATALWTLTLAYGLLPCVLKLVALALLAATPIDEVRS
ncbi:MFS transporter [Fluviibacterium sp. S390]|uniref:MFS transporter n=1 Tax=Fluviibacterium sp. S390 TaxID=3415139 RepID=UPI003C799C8C